MWTNVFGFLFKQNRYYNEWHWRLYRILVLIEEPFSVLKLIKDISADIHTFLLFNIQPGFTQVAVIVDLLHELLSFSLEAPVQGEDGAVEALLYQAVHVPGLILRTAELHVEESQHDQDEEDDDSSEGHDDEQPHFIICVELLQTGRFFQCK